MPFNLHIEFFPTVGKDSPDGTSKIPIGDPAAPFVTHVSQLSNNLSRREHFFLFFALDPKVLLYPIAITAIAIKEVSRRSKIGRSLTLDFFLAT